MFGIFRMDYCAFFQAFRITEIKQSELDNLNKLHSLDISNNPLACNREFENLMTLLSKRKVSPNGQPASIANLARDSKDEEGTYSWEFLTKKVCGTSLPHPVEPLPAVSEEEIWERIDKDAAGNFDLKNTLDDGKVANDGKDDKTTESNKLDAIDDGDDLDGDDDEDDDGDEADDEGDDDDDNDESGEDYSDDNVDLKVNLIGSAPKLPTEAPEKKVKIDIKLLENNNQYDDLEPDVYMASVRQNEHGRYDYLWPMLIAILGALLLLIVIAKIVMMTCTRRNRQVRYNSAIIAAMSHPGRTKKDCGLVYQQLSEDLTGPATPRLNRYAPLHSVTVKAANLSYESSPFHHSNIVPEAV